MSVRLKAPVSIIKNNKQNAGIEAKFNDLILILNPKSQGGATGKNWNGTYAQIKEFLPKQHRIIFTKKAHDRVRGNKVMPKKEPNQGGTGVHK